MWTRFAARLHAWWHRQQIRNTIDEELAFHVEMERALHESEGLPADEARREALAHLGGTARVREEVLEVRTPRLVALADRVRQDLRYGFRTFARTPLAVASIVFVLACGIGLNTAVFSAVEALFFHPLPVPNASAVVYVSGPAGTWVDYEVFRERAHGAVLGVTPTDQRSSTLTSPEVHLWAEGEWVNANYFETLRLRPALGRFFVPSEDDPRNIDRAIVLSDDLWRRRFGADPNIIGQRIALDQEDCTVIGIAPPGFHGVSLPWRPSQFWATFAQQISGQTKLPTSAVAFVARLAPQVSIAALAAMVADRPGETSPAPGRTAYVLEPAVGPLAPVNVVRAFGFVRGLGAAIAAMALVVMLIAASNVVGILLARGVGRSTELAIRQALGATGRRLVAQLLTESVLLGLAAGAAGLLVAWLLLEAYHDVAPAETALDVAIDGRALSYTLVVCAAAGLLVGLAPARQALRISVLAALGAPGAGTPQRVRRRVRYGSVVPQIACSVALLVVAGTQARALFDLEYLSPGFRLDHVLTVQLNPPGRRNADPKLAASSDQENRAFFQAVTSRLSALPGVSAVALASALPSQAALFPRQPWVSRDSLDRRTPRLVEASRDNVSGLYFRVFDISLLAGRTFDDVRDSPTSPLVAVINATLARELAPDGNAIGRMVSRYSPDDRDKPPAWYEVVGVVSDTRDNGAAVPLVYYAVSQLPWTFGFLSVVAQTRTDPAEAAAAMRRTIVDINPDGAFSDVQTMPEVIARDHFARRLALALLAFAAGFGTLLAAVGLYSAVSYWVAEQARDLGVRATLGATRHDLIGLVVWDGLKTVLVALVPGLLLGFLGFQASASLVRYAIGPVASPDVGIVSAVVGLVVGVTLLACYLPGRRAAIADPLPLLRA